MEITTYEVSGFPASSKPGLLRAFFGPLLEQGLIVYCHLKPGETKCTLTVPAVEASTVLHDYHNRQFSSGSHCTLQLQNAAAAGRAASAGMFGTGLSCLVTKGNVGTTSAELRRAIAACKVRSSIRVVVLLLRGWWCCCCCVVGAVADWCCSCVSHAAVWLVLQLCGSCHCVVGAAADCCWLWFVL